jgi:DegV family protein with EDD domain
MQRIAIVTDSTADLPLSYYEENDITMVPLTVRFGEESYKDWIDMPPDDFYLRLRNAEELPKTSQPSVQEFLDAYNKYGDYDHIISIHISSKLSGTGQAASVAAQNSPVPVTVIDSKSATIGLGVLVKTLVEERNENKCFEDMIATIQRTIDNSRIVFYVDTLKYLEMGGRIGKASAIAGSLLDIKPILTLDNGIVAPLKKTRGKKKAIRELASYVSEISNGEILNAAFLHADNPRLMEDLESGIQEAGIKYNTVMKARAGCVIGTYVGPDTVAMVFYPANN